MAIVINKLTLPARTGADADVPEAENQLFAKMAEEKNADIVSEKKTIVLLFCWILLREFIL